MKQCLIVDDSASIRKVARRILEEVNIEAIEAETRTDALEQCNAEMPDCVLVDWIMPEGDVMKFISTLRALPNGDKPKVVYLTSEFEEVNVARAMRHGANAHMMKPFDREAFLRPLVEVGVL